MEKTKEPKIPNIQITYSDPEELEQLYSSFEFMSHVYPKVFERIGYAVDNNLDKIDVFNILNLSLIVEIERENFEDILNKLNNYYLELENFEMCHKIQELVKQL